MYDAAANSRDSFNIAINTTLAGVGTRALIA